jgi:XTP/dITP diphosphohydrolase
MSAVTDLLLATNNSKKLQEIRLILGEDFHGKIYAAGDFAQVNEPEETGSTFAENARLKAEHYARATRLPALADDSGLVVDALGGRPGVYSARYAPTDGEKITRLLEEMKSVPEGERSARFVCALCLSLPDGRFIEVEGTLEGSIGDAPTGNMGFGYDPVFVVASGEQTLAELEPGVKNSISHRASAMKKLRPHLLALQAAEHGDALQRTS